MKVLITSTIFPNKSHSALDPDVRLQQTIGSINSLKTLGYKDIFLVDNSGRRWEKAVESSLAPAKICVYDQYQFGNKGLSETYTLLNFLNDYAQELGDYPLLKLSGRYLLDKRLDEAISGYDIAGKISTVGHNIYGRIELFSTRCYLIRDHMFFKELLENALTEMYSHSNKILGLGSLKRMIKNQFSIETSEWYFNPQLPVEAVFIKLIKKQSLRVNKIDTLGLSGYAGSFNDLLIEE